jgi:acyl-CoA synthetase (AMP-forming)/AMP-acid ligase II
VLRVVDDSGRDVPRGQTGELWLAGPQVTEGYLNRPDLTAERFVEAVDPDSGQRMPFYRSGDLVHQAPNGELMYTGRADLQVKLRGYRIELSDIEAAVRRHPAVTDAVVLVREFKPGDARLVCAYTTAEGATATATQLREHIRDLLPSYMFPARYLRVDALPQTVNGKVDRAAIARLWEEPTNVKGSAR